MNLKKSIKLAAIAYAGFLVYGYFTMSTTLERHHRICGPRYTVELAELWKELCYEKEPYLKPLNFSKKIAIDHYILRHEEELVNKEEV